MKLRWGIELVRWVRCWFGVIVKVGGSMTKCINTIYGIFDRLHIVTMLIYGRWQNG